MRTNCTFAHPGTFGHECGTPAVSVAVQTSDLTVGGIYYARRCVECAQIKGGENAGTIRFERFNPETHQNAWR